jgi:hypothetical protein
MYSKNGEKGGLAKQIQTSEEVIRTRWDGGNIKNDKMSVSWRPIT